MELVTFVGALLAAVAAAAALARLFELGLVLLLLALLLDTLFMEAMPGLDIGVWLYPKDVICCLLVSAAAVRLLLLHGQLRRSRCIGVLFLLLFLLAILRGLPLYTLKAVGNETRGFFPFIAVLIYFSSFQYDRRRQSRLITIWLAGSIALGVLTFFRWIAANLGWAVASQWEGAMGESSMRVVQCAHAFYLTAAFFFSLYLYFTSSGPAWQRRLFLVLGPVLILLQHRTVWVAVILGMLWLAWRDTRFRTRFAVGMAASLVVGALLTLLLFGSRAESTERSLRYFTSDTGTLAWRIEGWKALLAEKAPPETLAIGQPFGAGFDRHVGTGILSASAHNFYLETLIQFGIPGVLLLFGLYVWSIGRLRRPPTISLYPDFRLWQAFLVMHLSYSVTYSLNYDQAVLLAVVVSVFSDSRSTAPRAMGRTRTWGIRGPANIAMRLPALPRGRSGISAQTSR